MIPEPEDDLLSLQLSGLSMLSPRYQRLVREVYERIPHADRIFEYRTIALQESNEKAPKGYARVTREEESETLPSEVDFPPDQIWAMTLFPIRLDRLSDTAARWVIAHEFAHIASGLRTGSVVKKGIAYTQQSPGIYHQAPPTSMHEDSASLLALEWGFDSELQAWLLEDCL